MAEDDERFFQVDGEQLLFVGDVAIVLALHDVRPVTTVVGKDFALVGGVDTQTARQLEQLLRFGLGHALEHHRLEQACHLRLHQPGRQIVGGTPLHVWPVTPILREHRVAVEFADRLVVLRRG